MQKRQEDISNNQFDFDFHLHTTWTDGANSSLEMHNSALENKLKNILFSEHARMKSEDWFPKFAEEIKALPTDECRSFVGCEVKVLDFDGNIDATKKIIDSCDLVMASVHRFPGEKGNVKDFRDTDPSKAIEIEFELSMAVLENPDVDILGHPFGMSYRRFSQNPSDDLIREVIKKCAITDVAFELNSRYHDRINEFFQWCKELGAPISLGSNAHNISEVGEIKRKLKA